MIDDSRTEALLARDPDSLTEEEVSFLRVQSQMHYTFEQAVKLILNSVYGAFANQYFHFYNVDIAETITLQGQDAIKYTERMANKYFREFYHRDDELHGIMGTRAPAAPIDADATVYCDTDSAYIAFEYAMSACGWTGPAKDFVLQMDAGRMGGYFRTVLGRYAEHYGVDNFLDFELETVAEKALFVTKKAYVQDVAWKDGKEFVGHEYVKTTGLEIVRSSTPRFCRERLVDMLRFVLTRDNNAATYAELVAKVKGLKKEFDLSNVERIAMTSSVSNYNKHVADDQGALELMPGCPIHVRAAAYHNYLVNKEPERKRTYPLIKGGDKLKWYYAKDEFCDAFAFKAGAHPSEFAPQVDREKLFSKVVIDPLNRVLVPAGYQPLNPTLAYTVGLF